MNRTSENENELPTSRLSKVIVRQTFFRNEVANIRASNSSATQPDILYTTSQKVAIESLQCYFWYSFIESDFRTTFIQNSNNKLELVLVVVFNCAFEMFLYLSMEFVLANFIILNYEFNAYNCQD